MKTYKCCFCKQVFRGWGNNPAPVNNDENAICCDICNITIVIPERIQRLREHRDDNKTV